MEKAGAKETPDEAERKGLGTPATRAAIIEKLVSKGFLERISDKKVKHLIPTATGTALIEAVPEIIRSPAMTAEWEQKLLQVEKSQMQPEEFMREIAALVKNIVQETGQKEVVKMNERQLENALYAGQRSGSPRKDGSAAMMAAASDSGRTMYFSRRSGRS